MSLCACREGSYPEEDLGPFYVEDHGSSDSHVALDYPSIEGLDIEVEGPFVILGGLTRLITPGNPDPGEVLPNVKVTVYDMTQRVLASTVSDDEGAFLLVVQTPEGGIDGYVEAKLQDYPTIRQFDRRLDEHWTNIRLRMVSWSLYDIPRQVLGQKDELGYIQGSVYDRNTEVPLAGVRVKTTSGEVAYLSKGLMLPSKELEASEAQGVFFVANCMPGPVTLTVESADGTVLATRTVLAFRRPVLTQVGIPIPFTPK